MYCRVNLTIRISIRFGISQLQSPARQRPDNKSSYSILQNAARGLFNEAITNSTSDGAVLTQQFEDFVADFDKFVEEEKKKKNDLQEQVRMHYNRQLQYLHATFSFFDLFSLNELLLRRLVWAD